MYKCPCRDHNHKLGTSTRATSTWAAGIGRPGNAFFHNCKASFLPDTRRSRAPVFEAKITTDVSWSQKSQAMYEAERAKANISFQHIPRQNRISLCEMLQDVAQAQKETYQDSQTKYLATLPRKGDRNEKGEKGKGPGVKGDWKGDCDSNPKPPIIQTH